MQIKVKLVYQIFVTKPRRIQWRTEEAYLKSEAVAALPKLRRGLGGADYEDCFLKDAGHDRVYCFRLAPKVRLPSGSVNDRQSLPSIHHLLHLLIHKSNNSRAYLVRIWYWENGVPQN